MDDMQCIDIWKNDVEPLLIKVKRTITFDSALTQTIEEILNKVDSDIFYKKDFSDRLTGIIGVLSSQQYILYAERNLYKEEYNLLMQLSQELNKLFKIAKHEYKFLEEEEVETLRKERIPNQKVSTEDIYAPSKIGKKRIY